MSGALALACLIAGAVGDDAPPDRGILELIRAVDETRLIGHIERLSGVTGTPRIRSRNIMHPDILLAERYLVATLEAEGLEVRRIPLAGTASGAVPLVNIEAVLRGVERPDEIHVVGAHYDSTASSDRGWDPATDDAPGADDDATGCAIVLEIARQLASAELAATVRFVFFTAEEEGLLGSAAYAQAAHDAGEDIRSMLAIDPAGNTGELGDNIFFTYDMASVDDAKRMEAIGARYRSKYPVVIVPGDLAASPDDRSDHKSFWDRGFPALHGAALPGPGYHTRQDTAETIDLDFVAETTKMITAHVAESAGFLRVIVPAPTPPDGCACSSTGR